jgi:Sec-independent protein translocase protein TatA
MDGVLGLIGNLELSELVIIAFVAILIFGRRLPQAAGQAAARMGRARRSLETLWRESGIEREVREVQREIERLEAPHERTPGAMARRASEDVWRRAGEEPPAEAGPPDERAARAPAAEEARDA